MAYTRKTYDEYEIQGNNGYGWECECTEETWKEAKAQAKCYRENVNYPIRIVKKRVKIETLESQPIITLKRDKPTPRSNKPLKAD